MKENEKKMIIILVVSLILLDQIVKVIMLTAEKVVAPQEILARDNLTYILISIIGIMLFYKYLKSNNVYIKKENRIVLSFALAGVIGNMIDRIWKGYVINYIKIPNFTEINLAYIYIIIAWIGFAAILSKYTVKEIRAKKRKKEK